ncbi:MAG: hypothetical protein JNJ83_02580 [Verrucomicrobiaceae bacterium]|nr:hypothetical protein [Verrucomicrobiaceae bacterium]
MKLYTSSAFTMGPQSSVAGACARNGLIELANVPVHAVQLVGENLLLAAQPNDHRSAYGSVVYVVSACGRRALAVISRTVCFKAAVSKEATSAILLQDIADGIEFAKANLNQSIFNLDGAVEAARSWIRVNRSTLATSSQGSVVLLGSGRTQALCRRSEMIPTTSGKFSPLINVPQPKLVGLQFAA